MGPLTPVERPLSRGYGTVERTWQIQAAVRGYGTYKAVKARF